MVIIKKKKPKGLNVKISWNILKLHTKVIIYEFYLNNQINSKRGKAYAQAYIIK